MGSSGTGRGRLSKQLALHPSTRRRLRAVDPELVVGVLLAELQRQVQDPRDDDDIPFVGPTDIPSVVHIEGRIDFEAAGYRCRNRISRVKLRRCLLGQLATAPVHARERCARRRVVLAGLFKVVLRGPFRSRLHVEGQGNLAGVAFLILERADRPIFDRLRGTPLMRAERTLLWCRSWYCAIWPLA